MIQEPTLKVNSTIATIGDFLDKQKKIAEYNAILTSTLTPAYGWILVEQRQEHDAIKVSLRLIDTKNSDLEKYMIDETEFSTQILVIKVGSDTAKIKVGDEPIIDWENSLGIRRIKLRDGDMGMAQLIKDLTGLSVQARQELFKLDKPLVTREYLLVRESVIQAWW